MKQNKRIGIVVPEVIYREIKKTADLKNITITRLILRAIVKELMTMQ